MPQAFSLRRLVTAARLAVAFLLLAPTHLASAETCGDSQLPWGTWCPNDMEPSSASTECTVPSGTCGLEQCCTRVNQPATAVERTIQPTVGGCGYDSADRKLVYTNRCSRELRWEDAEDLCRETGETLVRKQARACVSMCERVIVWHWQAFWWHWQAFCTSTALGIPTHHHPPPHQGNLAGHTISAHSRFADICSHARFQWSKAQNPCFPEGAGKTWDNTNKDDAGMCPGGSWVGTRRCDTWDHLTGKCTAPLGDGTFKWMIDAPFCTGQDGEERWPKSKKCWASGEPNSNNVEHCVEQYGADQGEDREGKFNNNECHNKRGFYCSKCEGGVGAASECPFNTFLVKKNYACWTCEACTPCPQGEWAETPCNKGSGRGGPAYSSAGSPGMIPGKPFKYLFFKATVHF